MEYAEKEVISVLNRKCAEDGCTNRQHGGTVLCVTHLHGFPEKLPQWALDYAKAHPEVWEKVYNS